MHNTERDAVELAHAARLIFFMDFQTLPVPMLEKQNGVVRYISLSIYLWAKAYITDDGLEHLGIWESHSWEILILEGNLCNFEGKFII